MALCPISLSDTSVRKLSFSGLLPVSLVNNKENRNAMMYHAPKAVIASLKLYIRGAKIMGIILQKSI
jgi:hypothetical protein